MRAFFIAIGLLATVSLTSTARASATIDLFWQSAGGPATIDVATVNSTSDLVLFVVLTAGPNSSNGAQVSIDYGDAFTSEPVLQIVNNPNAGDVDAPLPVTLSAPIDEFGIFQVNAISAGALPPNLGTGLSPGASWLLGSVAFDKAKAFEGAVISGAFFPTDAVLDGGGNNITGASTFNSATIVPEPGIAASSLSAGLVLVGLYAARRRSSNESRRDS